MRSVHADDELLAAAHALAPRDRREHLAGVGRAHPPDAVAHARRRPPDGGPQGRLRAASCARVPSADAARGRDVVPREAAGRLHRSRSAPTCPTSTPGGTTSPSRSDLHSTLELAVGGVPLPRGEPDGSWRYRHAVRPEGPTSLDRQAVADFVAYETAHGRTVRVVADPALADWRSWKQPARRGYLPPRSQASAAPTSTSMDADPSSCVTARRRPSPRRSWAMAGFVQPPRSRVATAERCPRRAPGVSPPDYFDHVMFANGRCTAPEAVASSRVLGRDLVPADLDAATRPRCASTWRGRRWLPDGAVRRRTPGEDPRPSYLWRTCWSPSSSPPPNATSSGRPPTLVRSPGRPGPARATSRGTVGDGRGTSRRRRWSDWPVRPASGCRLLEGRARRPSPGILGPFA